MKKYIISAVAVLVSLAVVWSAFGQAAGGGRQGGQGGQRGQRGGQTGRARQRPAREERLAAIKELGKQIEALKTAIGKAPATDPNIANLEGDALTKFMAQYTEESAAVNAIQQTLSNISGRAGGGGRGGFGGASADVLSELRVLAQNEKASKTVARLDALIKEEQTRRTRRGTDGGERTGRGGRGAGGAGGGGQ